MDLFRGPAARARAERMEEELKGMVEKMLQMFTWHTLEEREEDFRGSKTFLLFKVQMKESKETNFGGFVASK